MKLQDIKKFPFASYIVNVSWKYLPQWLESQGEKPEFMSLDMNPFFQRDYVWTDEQKISYIEYRLKGGFSGKDIFWNCPSWMRFKGKGNNIQLVDGKQRLNAALQFLNNEIPAFGHLLSEFEDKIHPTEPDFIFHVNNLQTEREVVEWYVGFNTGGSVHTEKDLKPALDYLKENA